MFIFGHLGFGSMLARPWRSRLPTKWLLLGTLLPDLIDKPLYYGLRSVGHNEFISCTRTLGHTGLFMLTLALLAAVKRSPALTALAIGTATHIFLDNLGDLFGLNGPSFAWIALWFPFYQTHFGNQGERTMLEHLLSLNELYTWVTEPLGIALLYLIYRRPGTARKMKNSQGTSAAMAGTPAQTPPGLDVRP